VCTTNHNTSYNWNGSQGHNLYVFSSLHTKLVPYGCDGMTICYDWNHQFVLYCFTRIWFSLLWLIVYIVNGEIKMQIIYINNKYVNTILFILYSFILFVIVIRIQYWLVSYRSNLHIGPTAAQVQGIPETSKKSTTNRFKFRKTNNVHSSLQTSDWLHNVTSWPSLMRLMS